MKTSTLGLWRSLVAAALILGGLTHCGESVDSSKVAYVQVISTAQTLAEANLARVWLWQDDGSLGAIDQVIVNGQLTPDSPQDYTLGAGAQFTRHALSRDVVRVQAECALVDTDVSPEVIIARGQTTPTSASVPGQISLTCVANLAELTAQRTRVDVFSNAGTNIDSNTGLPDERVVSCGGNASVNFVVRLWDNELDNATLTIVSSGGLVGAGSQVQINDVQGNVVETVPLSDGNVTATAQLLTGANGDIGSDTYTISALAVPPLTSDETWEFIYTDPFGVGVTQRIDLLDCVPGGQGVVETKFESTPFYGEDTTGGALLVTSQNGSFTWYAKKDPGEVDGSWDCDQILNDSQFTGATPSQDGVNWWEITRAIASDDAADAGQSDEIIKVPDALPCP